jgi:hypothetical protein
MVLIIIPAALAFLSFGALCLVANMSTLVSVKVYKRWSNVPLIRKAIAGNGWATGGLILVLILVGVVFVLAITLPRLISNR